MFRHAKVITFVYVGLGGGDLHQVARLPAVKQPGFGLLDGGDAGAGNFC